MKDVYEVLQQKEADVANVRLEIQGLKLVYSLLSGESALEDVCELLQQREADVARVRHEIDNLKIVAPLLWKNQLPMTDSNTRRFCGKGCTRQRRPS